MSTVEEPLSSPERSPPVKVKYSTRRKRRQSKATDDVEESPEEETKNEAEEEGGADPEKPTSNSSETSTKRAPKKVDVVLRGPSPTPSRQESPATGRKSASKARKATRSRAGSVVSLAQDDADSPSTRKIKPLSAIGGSKAFQTPARRAQSPDSIADDQSVCGESSRSGTRARKSEAERIEFLQNDALTGDVEPHRVFCKECQEWVDLAPKRKYVMQHWVAHRKQKHKQRGNADKHDHSDLKSELAAEEDEENGSVAASLVAPLETPRGDKTSRERPSNRITAMQRKLALVNDGQVRKLTGQTVECAVCRAEVGVKGEVDYDLGRWEEHKAGCTRSTPRPAAPSEATPGAAKEPPAGALQAPRSVASTEGTAVGSEASPSRGEKRGREEDEDEGDSRRAVRARTVFYEAPEGESPGFLDWLAQPFRSFVQGFREGLSSG